jgi:hypothetical protein
LLDKHTHALQDLLGGPLLQWSFVTGRNGLLGCLGGPSSDLLVKLGHDDPDPLHSGFDAGEFHIARSFALNLREVAKAPLHAEVIGAERSAASRAVQRVDEFRRQERLDRFQGVPPARLPNGGRTVFDELPGDFSGVAVLGMLLFLPLVTPGRMAARASTG